MSECASDEEIIEILRLPNNEEGKKQFYKMLEDLGSSFTNKEKIFILLYTNPLSKLCGKMNQCSLKVSTYKSYGNWLMQNPKIKKLISDLQDQNTLDKIKQALTEDAERCIEILNMDRTSYRKDEEFTFNDPKTGKDVTVETIKEKAIYELTKKQKDAIADYSVDKNGRLHPVIEKRSEARAALQNYQKLYGGVNNEDEKTTETVVTLEAIKNKTIAKIQVIQKNNEDALKAGDFIDAMKDTDEEA